MKIKFTWTDSYASYIVTILGLNSGGYIPENVDPEKWKGYTASVSGDFLGHDAMAHQDGETGKTWEEARAIGATLYLFGKDEFYPIPSQIVRESEKEGTWTTPPPFEESEFTKKLRQNLQFMTDHVDEWVGWVVEGWRYAEASPYTPQHYKAMRDIPFHDLWRDNKGKAIVVDLETKSVEVINE